jgi:outer membrane protein TolC
MGGLVRFCVESIVDIHSQPAFFQHLIQNEGFDRMLQSVTMRHQFDAIQRRRRLGQLACLLLLFIIAAALTAQGFGQTAATAVDTAESAKPVLITLDEAIKRAEANEPAYAASTAESRTAGQERGIALAGLLPSATYHNQALYTQTDRGQVIPRFIANNAEREYSSQAVVDETLGLGRVAEVRRADAAAARAAAELEIARRGLVAAVTSLYYGVAAAENKQAILERAEAEAAEFSGLTGKREQAREAAHADVVKAQLLQQQRERDFSDAKLAAEKARLELGVLLFADPRTPYVLVAGDATAQLPTRAEVEEAAGRNNAELKSALAAVKESDADVLAARAAYLPDLALNYTYGIDAPQFAANGPDHLRNLGYSASVTLDIPVWDWLSTERKVKQSEIKREAARVSLTATQRRLIARLDEAWSEAVAAREQLASLDASVATAGESLRLTNLRYAEGEATVLEVVDAQTAFVSIENAREDGRVRYQAARADLQTLTGTM